MKDYLELLQDLFEPRRKSNTNFCGATFVSLCQTVHCPYCGCKRTVSEITSWEDENV